MLDMTFTIKELADLCGVSTRTLRFYEEKGLISSKRLDNNYRVYGLDAVSRIELIVTLKESALSLDKIKETLENRSMIDEVLTKVSENSPTSI